MSVAATTGGTLGSTRRASPHRQSRRDAVTASVVAVSGVIGWFGLMVPHMARMIAGDRFDRMLPATLLLGASFMIVVDTLARSIASIEVPLGVLTALVGAPTFVWLLARRRGLRCA